MNFLKVPSARAAALLAGVFLVVLVAGFMLGVPKFEWGSEHYINLAKGHSELVPKPFSNRILHPLLASALMRAGLSLDAAHVVLAVAAMLVLLAMCALTVGWFGSERAIWPVVLLCPLLIAYFREAYMVDLFHAALLAALCAALAWAEWLVFPILIAMEVCRESTILVVFVLVLYFAWRRKFGYAVGSVISFGLGVLIVSRLVPASSHNIHSMSTVQYIIAKTFWNFFRNWTGIVLWRSSFQWSCPADAWNKSIPFLHVVACSWEPSAILNTWTDFLGTLSLSFAFLATAWRPLMADRNRRSTKLLLALAFYGVLAAIVGTFTGTAVYRLVGYGWPLLWIAVPILFNTTLRSVQPLWLLLHWALMWLRLAIPFVPPVHSPGAALPICEAMVFCTAVIALNIVAWKRMRTTAGIPQDVGRNQPEVSLA